MGSGSRRLAALVGVGGLLLSACAWGRTATVDSAGGKADGRSDTPSLSADGRYVAFASDATDLVGNDHNDQPDIFVRDLRTGVTTRVSVDQGGGDANGPSSEPYLSADGRYVEFLSLASDLVAGDANNKFDSFVRDRMTGTTTRTSFDATGGEPNGDIFEHQAFSANGRYVAIRSTSTDLVAAPDTNGETDIYVRDLQTGTNVRASVDASGGDSNGESLNPALSDDGRIVMFMSLATDLVPDDTNGLIDIFVRDLQTGVTTNVTNGGLIDPGTRAALSGNGRYVALAGVVGGGVYVYDRQLQTSTLASPGGLSPYEPSISADGRYVAFNEYGLGDDTRGLFVRDRQRGVTTNVAVSPSYPVRPQAPTISADGQYLAFVDWTDSVVGVGGAAVTDVFVRSTFGPVVTSAAPATVARGSTATVVLNGSNILPGAKASAFGGVVISNPIRLSDTQLQVTISVAADAAVGARIVFVANPGTGPGAEASTSTPCTCLTIS